MRNLSLILAVSLIGVISVSIYDGISTEDTTESLSLGGVFYITAYHEDGTPYFYHQSHNLVPTEGENTMADLIFPDINFNGNGTDAKFDYVGIGTGSTAPADANTGIETPIAGCARLQDATVAGNAAITGGAATIQVQPAAFSGANCAGTITEAAIFNSETGGEILARQTFAGLAVGAGDSLTVEYNFTVSDDGV